MLSVLFKFGERIAVLLLKWSRIILYTTYADCKVCHPAARLCVVRATASEYICTLTRSRNVLQWWRRQSTSDSVPAVLN